MSIPMTFRKLIRFNTIPRTRFYQFSQTLPILHRCVICHICEFTRPNVSNRLNNVMQIKSNFVTAMKNRVAQCMNVNRSICKYACTNLKITKLFHQEFTVYFFGCGLVTTIGYKRVRNSFDIDKLGQRATDTIYIQ